VAERETRCNIGQVSLQGNNFTWQSHQIGRKS